MHTVGSHTNYSNNQDFQDEEVTSFCTYLSIIRKHMYLDQRKALPTSHGCEAIGPLRNHLPSHIHSPTFWEPLKAQSQWSPAQTLASRMPSFQEGLGIKSAFNKPHLMFLTNNSKHKWAEGPCDRGLQLLNHRLFLELRMLRQEISNPVGENG